MSHERALELVNDARFQRIRYWILTPSPKGGYSPFQGYGLEILSRDFIALTDIASILPTHPAELFLPPNELGSFRSTHLQSMKSIVGEMFFEDLYRKVKLEQVLDVLIGLPTEITRASRYVDPASTILLSSDNIDGAVSLRCWAGHPSQVIDKVLAAKIWPTINFNDPQSERAPQPRAAIQTAYAPREMYGATIPNEVLCLSLGANLSVEIKPDPSRPESYADAIIASAERALALLGRDSTDLILFSPSLIKEHYKFNNSFWNKLLREIKNKKIRIFVRDGIFRNKHYSGISLHDAEEEDIKFLKTDPVVVALVGARALELRACATAVAALSCSMVAPAIRLPNSINFSLGLLQEIERHSARNDRRSATILQKAFKTLVDGLAKDIDPRLLGYTKEHGDSITIVADAPIEWLRVDGLPMMFRHNCSRIPMTPGNVMMSTCMESTVVTISSRSLHDVLVVRSFKAQDPIRGYLERAVTGFPITSVRTSFVDVSDRATLVDCLNAFNGQIVIFDCHGGHGGDGEPGWLMIGNEKVDTWSLAHEARVPPIVILSACSTFALAGSHASVANGLIRSGAVTVLGTFLPVDAVKSAVFTARILYRIDKFLPALSRVGRNYLTWKTFVSTFLRMSYCTDIIHFFSDYKALLPVELSEEIGISANHDVNSLNPRWHINLLDRIAAGSGLSSEQAIEMIEDESPLMETMLYCQTGRPDRIGIFIESEEEMAPELVI